ncbi:efflux RND transporter permease subunit [Neisseriaceae bacterium TC5R-5]|nr:efflux RND transporter permease subunit [Neisseriaceae bacterium TC5R-5]
MNLARVLIEKPLFAWLIILISVFGGLFAYFNIGRLEDPNFTIKTALVITQYPGASAKEVEQEVTDRLESAIQQMEQVDYLESRSMPGFSEIRVHIRDKFTSPQLPQIWDELRKQVGDTGPTLPPGAGPSRVLDRFGDVYGIFYAITGKGYSPAQLYEYAREVRRQLLMLDNVADVVVTGQQQEQITVEINQANLIANNLSPDDVAQALNLQNQIRPSGRERVGDWLVQIKPSGALSSVEAIRSLPIGQSANPVLLGDIAKVSHGYAPIPGSLIRFNQQPALNIGISARAQVDVVKVGAEVRERLQQLEKIRPPGIQWHVLYDQPKVVESSVQGFVFDVLLSVSVVGIALCFGLGWRAGLILGIELLLSVMITVALMYVAGIELQRVSLGALIIVMGMLADNSIVVCEGMLVRVQKGMSHVAAAGEVLMQSKWILLASTVVGILAFAGIGLSPDSVGEFCASLFSVAIISLLSSWVIAIALTPLLGKYLLKVPEGELEDPFAAPIYQKYGRFLAWVTRRNLWVIGGLALITVLCIAGFRFVERGFFPVSETPLFYVDLNMPRGTDIRATSELMAKAEQLVAKQQNVSWISSYIGGGATRFFLTYDPETRDPAYGQFVVRVQKVEQIEAMMPKIDKLLSERFPEARWTLSRPAFGPNSGPKIQARFSGPNPEVLRRLSQQAQQLLHADGRMIAIRDDWDPPVSIIRPQFDEGRARSMGVTRRHLSDTLAYGSEGLLSGLYREGDQLLPIMLRAPDSEQGVSNLLNLQVFSSGLRRYVPIGSVLSGSAVETENGRIARRTRDRTLTVLANPAYGDSSVDAFERIRPAIESIKLPAGYQLVWGGEHESSTNAQTSLFRQLPMAFLGMALLVLLMFGRVKPALVVLLVVPMSICGVTIGLLMFGGSFGFIALLGLLSLFGMLIKNAAMVVQEIDDQIAAGVPRQKALVEGTMSRLRPVALAAGTTILGMVPLLWDGFFYDMAITMMAGLAFATVLTLVAVPALYACFFSIKESEWS